MKSVPAWQADDGSLHLTQESCKDADFLEAITTFVQATAANNRVVDPMNIAQFLYLHRAGLIKIFKLLNGGAPITAPATPKDEDAPRPLTSEQESDLKDR